MSEKEPVSDRAKFDQLRTYHTQLVAYYKERNDMYDQLRAMYHMEWQDRPKGDHVKETMSPDAYNAATGAVRLLVSTDPQFSVPFDESDADAKTVSDKMEQAGKAMWNGSGRVMRRQVHYELVLAAILFGEVDASVTRTAELVEDAEKTKDKAHIARMKALAAETPYFYRAYNPRNCYPDFDHWGLRGHLYRVETTWGQVLDAWGSLAEAADKAKGRNRLDKVVLNDWYDWENRCLYLDGCDDPLIFDAHELEFMPVESAITDGSFMFDRPDLQRQPFLFPLWKSQMWRRQNLLLTSVFTTISILTTAMFKRKGNKGNALQVVLQGLIPFVDMDSEEDLTLLAERMVNPELMNAIGLTERKGEESTISRQALGAPPENLMAFSAISLLTQSGRLPLMGPKNVCGMVIGNLTANALRWWKADGAGDKFYNYANGTYVDLKPKELPERIVMKAVLEPDLPTDKLQLANTADMLVKSKLASRRWVRENILQIGQSDAMEKEIWTEDRLMLEIVTRLKQIEQMTGEEGKQAMMQMAEQMHQQMMSKDAAPAGGAMGASTGMGGDAGQPLTAYPPGGKVTEGAPLTGPLPPRGTPPTNGGRMMG